MEEEALGEGRAVVRIGAHDLVGLDRNLGGGGRTGQTARRQQQAGEKTGEAGRRTDHDPQPCSAAASASAFWARASAAFASLRASSAFSFLDADRRPSMFNASTPAEKAMAA